METAAKKTYEYDPVSKELLETRVLTLYPGEHEDDIHFRLEKLDLALPDADTVEYEALSYVWGSPSTPCTATSLDSDGHPGGTLPVTESLNVALRYLRLQHRPRTLWVDALCINQSDVRERNHQVQWMDQVYKKARHVVVFLGPASEDDIHAIETLTSIGKSIDMEGSKIRPLLKFVEHDHPEATGHHFHHTHKLRKLMPSLHTVAAALRMSKNQTFFKLSGHPPPEILDYNGAQAERLRMLLPSVRAVVALLHRSWFSRLWVIQEVRSMHDQTQGVLQCGSRTVSWNDFRKGVITFRHMDQVYVDSQEAMLLAQDALNSITLMLCQMEYGISVRDCLGIDYFNCSDTRDRLYGVLSLLRDKLSYPVAVDYKRPAEDVFEELQRNQIRAVGLELLIHCHFDPSKTWRAPSWVPNQLSVPTHIRELSNSPTYRFPSQSNFVGDSGLRVFGRVVATVQTVVVCPPLMEHWSFVEGPALMLDWLRKVASKLGETSSLKDEAARSARMAEKFLQLCDIGGYYDETFVPRMGHLSRRQLTAIIVHIMSSKQTSDSFSKEVSDQMFGFYANLHRAHGYSSRPVLFSTDTDDVGYGPASVLPGDQVCAVLGCSRSMVLRPAGDAKHVVIGPAAVGGDMRSESLLGPLPGHVYLVLDIAEGRRTFYDVRTCTKIHDPRLERLGLGGKVKALPDTYLREGDLEVNHEELKRGGMPLESFALGRYRE